MADSIHCIKKTLRLKPAEAEILALIKATEAGMCEAGYLRLLVTQKPYDYPEIRSLLKALINEVNAVGNNINQITRASNSYLVLLTFRQAFLTASTASSAVMDVSYAYPVILRLYKSMTEAR